MHLKCENKLLATGFNTKRIIFYLDYLIVIFRSQLIQELDELSIQF